MTSQDTYLRQQKGEDDIEISIISPFLGCRVSPETFPLPGYPDVSFPAELVVSSEEDPVVSEPHTVQAGGLDAGGEAEEDVPGVGAAGEMRGN